MYFTHYLIRLRSKLKGIMETTFILFMCGCRGLMSTLFSWPPSAADGTISMSDEPLSIHVRPISERKSGAGVLGQFEGKSIDWITSAETSSGIRISTRWKLDRLTISDGVLTKHSIEANATDEEEYIIGIPGGFQRPPWRREPSPVKSLANRAGVTR